MSTGRTTTARPSPSAVHGSAAAAIWASPTRASAANMACRGTAMTMKAAIRTAAACTAAAWSHPTDLPSDCFVQLCQLAFVAAGEDREAAQGLGVQVFVVEVEAGDRKSVV